MLTRTATSTMQTSCRFIKHRVCNLTLIVLRHCSSPEEVILAAATTEHEDGEEDTTEDTATPRASAEPSAETQAAGSKKSSIFKDLEHLLTCTGLASATEVSGALVMLSAAVAALYAF